MELGKRKKQDRFERYSWKKKKILKNGSHFVHFKFQKMDLTLLSIPHRSSSKPILKKVEILVQLLSLPLHHGPHAHPQWLLPPFPSYLARWLLWGLILMTLEGIPIKDQLIFFDCPSLPFRLLRSILLCGEDQVQLF